MRVKYVVGGLAVMVLAILVPLVHAPRPPNFSIHPLDYGTTISYTSMPGKKIGCLTSGVPYTIKVDFYYYGIADQDQRIIALIMESGDGVDENSYVPVAFSVTWEYSIDGEVTWNAYSGIGDIDVPYSGKNGVGQLETTDPHATVALTFPVTGSLGDEFYYRIHFRSWYYGKSPPQPGNTGNHHFWYEICNVDGSNGVPEFPVELPLVTSLGFVVAYIAHRKRLSKY